ncbi:MAG: hypothetical protein QHG99_01535 [Methanomicrobiales archaeon]|nr:hypothetical protein [Methanomicrobiales archaeon]
MMQLPTCSEYIEKRGQKTGAIIQDLATRGFSGYCTLLVDGVWHLLVLEKGSVILAESQGRRGEHALEQIKMLLQREADAILCELSTAVLKATIEANRTCAVKKEETGEKSDGISSRAAITKAKPVSMRQGDTRKIQIRSIVARAETETQGGAGKKVQNPSASPVVAGGKKIDRMTLESIKELKETFQSDAADLLRELRMEHLMVRKHGKESGSSDSR